MRALGPRLMSDWMDGDGDGGLILAAVGNLFCGPVN